MASSSSMKNHLLHQPSSSATSADVENKDTDNPNSITTMEQNSVAKEPQPLSQTHLSHKELLERRLKHANQLSKCYREYYWDMVEELKVQYHKYVREYGVSPFKEMQGENSDNESKNNDEDVVLKDVVVVGETNNQIDADTFAELEEVERQRPRCAFVGCESKAMPLTTFCFLHILNDPRQRLYKPCQFGIRRSEAGLIRCAKPILVSYAPPVCDIHLHQIARILLHRSLRLKGLNVPYSRLVEPKFHPLVTRYVQHIRRTSKQRKTNKSESETVDKQEKDS